MRMTWETRADLFDTARRMPDPKRRSVLVYYFKTSVSSCLLLPARQGLSWLYTVGKIRVHRAKCAPDCE